MSSNIQAVQTGSGWGVDGPMTVQALVELDTTGRPIRTVTPDGQVVVGLQYRGPWDQRPTSGLTVGDRAEFTDIGAGVVPWYWDGDTWMPAYRTTIAQNLSTITGVLSTDEQVLVSLPLPAGILPGKILDVLYTLGRDGTTNTVGVVNLRIGPTGTVSDPTIGTINFSSNWGTSRALGVHNSTLFNKAATSNAIRIGTPAGGASWAGSTSGASVNTAFTVPGLNAPAFFTVTAQMTAPTTRPQIGFVRLEVRP